MIAAFHNCLLSNYFVYSIFSICNTCDIPGTNYPAHCLHETVSGYILAFDRKVHLSWLHG